MNTPEATAAHPLGEAAGSALRALLENSVVMSSTEDDVTICVTAKAYEDAYKAAYPHPADDPNHVHPHDCGYTVTGRICNCDCEWRAHDNTGMRYPERSDTTGGETDVPNK